MSEEMRKEFEEFWINYCANRGVNCNLARLINGEYASWPEHNAYVGWQASREAMRPIRLPEQTDTSICRSIEKEILYDGINYGIKLCKEAIETAGYKVVP